MRLGDWVVGLAAMALVSTCGGRSARDAGDDDDDDGRGRGGTFTGGDDGRAGTAVGDDDDDGGSSSVGARGGVGASGGVATSGASGSAGSAGTTSCEQPLDSFAVGCDAAAMLTQHCASGGCHNASTNAANINLAPDDLLVARVLDVPATFLGISPGPSMSCVPATCPPRGSTMLVDSVAPAESWMLRKMAAFDFENPNTPLNVGCGDAMPYPPRTLGFTPDKKACLDALFLAIAERGRPCSFPNIDAGVPPQPVPCPEGG